MKNLLFFVLSFAILGAQTVNKNLQRTTDASAGLIDSFTVPSGKSITPTGTGAIVATTVPWAGVTGTPTTLAGYGVSDSVVYTSGFYPNPTWITALAWSKITGTPTTRAGYGITDGQPLSANLTAFAAIAPSADVLTLLAAANFVAFKTSLSLNNVENTALSTWAGSASITTLGTISAGTIPVARVTGLAASATVDATNATNITSGTLPNARIVALPNANLANSSITIAGTATALGGSITQDGITGLASTGIVKRTGANALAIAVSATDYAPATSGTSILKASSGGFANAVAGTDYVAPGGSGAGLSGVTLSAVVPNTAPAAGQILVGNAGGTAYAPVSASGDVTITSAGVTAIGAGKVTNGMLAGSIDVTTKLTGTTLAAQEPAHTGDVTNSAGSLAMTLANIPTGVPLAGSILATNIVAPGTPAAGKVSVYADSTDLRFHDKNASGVIGTTVVADAGAANQWLASVTSAGVFTHSQPAFSNLSGSVAASQMPALTGDVTTTAGTVATTLATVATAGTTGSSTAIPVITIDAKGRTTSIGTAAVVAPAGTLSGTTLASGVTASSLTSLGTIAALSAGTGSFSSDILMTGASPGSLQTTVGDMTVAAPSGKTVKLYVVGTGTVASVSSAGLAVTGVLSATKTIVLTFNGNTDYGFDAKDTTDTSSAGFAIFRNSSGAGVGSISRVTTTNAVTYNTTSDGRLKTNIRDFTAADAGKIIDGLKPRWFDWKPSDTDKVTGKKAFKSKKHQDDSTAIIGFIAQEENDVDPALARIGAVTVGDNDSEKITRQWQRSDSALVPILVAVLKDDRARIAALEAKNKTLVTVGGLAGITALGALLGMAWKIRA